LSKGPLTGSYRYYFVDPAISTLLTRYNQEHIIKHLDLMSGSEKLDLLNEISLIDFELIAELSKSCQLETSVEKKNVFKEVDVLSFNRSDVSSSQKNRLYGIGEDCLREGKVAIFLVAGGQGTRLGFKGPKGCYSISPIKGKSLFQLFAENIRALQMRYGKLLNWYIMASNDNIDETRSFFKDNNFFGLKRDKVHFLIQGQIPSLDLNGRLIIARNKRIFQNPNGHGGAIKALHDSGDLLRMEQDGIEEIFYFQVDNPLVKIADPLFIGAHVEHKAEISSKVVKKVNSTEKVGIIGRVNGRLGCIEYSELSQKEKEERIGDGSLRFGSANIAVHMLNRNYVEKLNMDTDYSLPYHTAIKEIECLAEGDRGHVPAVIQGKKFEMFIFDALGFAKSSVTLEVSREDEFSPVKNRTGEDSPEKARKAMIDLHTKWLRSSGKVSSIPDNLVIEVSPLYALDDVEFRKKFIPLSRILSPLYLE
jgi:UDP-N-acetylglucosamine/UDP-N-acetylgalactosamine diphosphorylase